MTPGSRTTSDVGEAAGSTEAAADAGREAPALPGAPVGPAEPPQPATSAEMTMATARRITSW
jgi:hypothetical protein